MSAFERFSVALGAFQALIIILGFLVSYRQLSLLRRDSENGLELAYRESAMRLIARYSEPEFIARRVKLRMDPHLQQNLYECGYVLNFFEEIAIAIRHRTADETILEDFFGTILREWMEQDYMVEALKSSRRIDSAIFLNTIELYRSWEKNREKQLKINKIPELRA